MSTREVTKKYEDPKETKREDEEEKGQNCGGENIRRIHSLKAKRGGRGSSNDGESKQEE